MGVLVRAKCEICLRGGVSFPPGGSRSLSLRNLILGLGVWDGLSGGCSTGLTLKSDTNWLSPRSSRSVETRRRYGWLRMVFPRCAPLPSSNLVPFGRWWPARGRVHCRGKPGRDQQHAQAYRGTRYRASKHHTWRGWRAARSLTSHGIAGHFGARIKGANREVSEGKADL